MAHVLTLLKPKLFFQKSFFGEKNFFSFSDSLGLNFNK
ncbi:hypothetical protein PLO_0891 [Pediococcus acidilactici NGRI 0510Q]|nr:hypothetical protein PLO_0891 [Pediococcus acidilactici NGRI 0510Q]